MKPLFLISALLLLTCGCSFHKLVRGDSGRCYVAPTYHQALRDCLESREAGCSYVGRDLQTHRVQSKVVNQ